MKIVNLTPHTLNILNADGFGGIDVAPSGKVARVKVDRRMVGEVQEIPLYETVFGEVFDLPEAEEGVLFVVSGLVAAHPSVRNREDVYSPGELVRDEAGKPIGCRGLSRSM
jgi:hypothetical protein